MNVTDDPKFWHWIKDRDLQERNNKEKSEFEPIPLYLELDLPKEVTETKEEIEPDYFVEVDFTV